MKETYFNTDTIRDTAMKMMQTLELQHRKNTQFDPSRCALLVLDMQNVFLDSKSHAFVPSAPAIVPQIRRTMELFHRHDQPVIITRHTNTTNNARSMSTWWRNLIAPDSYPAMIHHDICIENATVLDKHQYDAFYETNLDNLLESLSVTTVVITGVMSHICCDTTARSAFQRGYSVWFAIDGTATYTRRLHMATLETLEHCCVQPVLLDTLPELFEASR